MIIGSRKGMSDKANKQERLSKPVSISTKYDPDAEVVFYEGSCMDILPQIPDKSIKLIVTSPPYNIGKEYEKRRTLEKYAEEQKVVITECIRILKSGGSLCWQVGNYVQDGEILPLDIFFYNLVKSIGEENVEHSMNLRNRVVWHFGHGLHCTNRFSGRHESILWFTKGNDYTFNLDAVRVPQKYPAKKAYKGPRKGELSGHPLGKNPSDIWEIPNVKSNHIEKTIHPCQFPVALIERLVLALTNEGDIVLDPFAGVGTTCVASIMNKRRSIGMELMREYVDIAHERIRNASLGILKTRPLDKPLYKPTHEAKRVQELLDSDSLE